MNNKYKSPVTIADDKAQSKEHQKQKHQLQLSNLLNKDACVISATIFVSHNISMLVNTNLIHSTAKILLKKM